MVQGSKFGFPALGVTILSEGIEHVCSPVKWLFGGKKVKSARGGFAAFSSKDIQALSCPFTLHSTFRSVSLALQQFDSDIDEFNALILRFATPTWRQSNSF